MFKKTKLNRLNFFLNKISAGNIFFVEYWLLEHISMRERGEKVEILNVTQGMSLFWSKTFSLFFT